MRAQPGYVDSKDRRTLGPGYDDEFVVHRQTVPGVRRQPHIVYSPASERDAYATFVGHDDIDLARNPLISLTTIDQLGVKAGKTAIDLLMERIRDGRTTPKHHRIQPKLRIRNSSREVSASLA